MSSEFGSFEQTDEDEFTLTAYEPEEELVFRSAEVDRLWDALVAAGWRERIADRDAARREVETEKADDPKDQPALDRVVGSYRKKDTSLRPRPGETAEETVNRVVDAVRKEGS